MSIFDGWRGRRVEAPTGVHELPANAVLRLPGGGGVVVRVERGQVVVTRAGDPHDHVLEAGMTMTLDGPGAGTGDVLAWALAPSRLDVRRAPERAGVPAEPALAR